MSNTNNQVAKATATDKAKKDTTATKLASVKKDAATTAKPASTAPSKAKKDVATTAKPTAAVKVAVKPASTEKSVETAKSASAVPSKATKTSTKAKKPRMLEMYNKTIVPALKKELGFKNVNQVPKLEKIVINTGLGDVKDNAKSFNAAVDEIGIITGQKPVVTLAKKSVSNFKLREGMRIGAKVTLRGHQMYEFLDRLISVALPRVRDFRGVSPKSFDSKGNYNMGIKEQLVFPEINYDKIEKVRGFDVCIVTNAKSDAHAKALLDMMGMPFRKN